MKLYTKTISQTLPDWVTIVTQNADLFEIEINDEHSNFQSLLEELATISAWMKQLQAVKVGAV